MVTDLLDRSCTKIAIYALFLAALYYSAFKWLVTYDWLREDYSYGCLIPFVVMYLLWENRQQIASTPSIPEWRGLVAVGLGIVLFWLGELGGEYFTVYISFWLVIVGLCWLHLGWRKSRSVGFALLILLATFPFPSIISGRMSLYLKLVSSQIGVRMLQVCGISAYREGNIIDLGFTQLQVVDACSGLRYVLPLMVLSLVLAYWFKAHLWKRAALFLSSIPLAIIVNSTRIAITGLLYGIFGAKVAEGFFHGFSSWLIFIAAIPLLLVEMWILRKLPPSDRGTTDDRSVAGSRTTDGVKAEGSRKREERSVDNDEREERFAMKTVTQSVARKMEESANAWRAAILQPVFVVAVLLLGTTLALSHIIEFRQKIHAATPLQQFPLQVGEWRGSRQGMGQEFIQRLAFSDYVMVDYRNSREKGVNFYVAYYASQTKGESIHSPETCLPGSGWDFREAGAASVPISEGNPGSIKVKRAFIEKSGKRELAYYWFPQRGRVLTSAWQLKVYTFWDALTRQRTDGALVRLITPVYASESLLDAETRLQEFTRLIVPVLDQYIPK